jgi:hypothetical protein
MTRARYFLLVPWTYQKLEKQKVSSAEIAAKARRAELGLVQPIEDSDDNDGNIGKLAKTTLNWMLPETENEHSCNAATSPV